MDESALLSLRHGAGYAATVRDRMQQAGVIAADLAAMFSSAVLKDLAHARPGRHVRRIAGAAPLLVDHPAATVADAFEEAHATLLRERRSEYVFKNALVSKIVFGYHRPSTASALLELPMGDSCADVVIMNGTSTVYEIKTDLDQFSRLSTQLRDYRTRAEHVYVVVSDSRAISAERYLPDGVGLIALTNRGRLRALRPAVSNMPRLDTSHLFNLLRRSEALRILERQMGYTPDVAPVDLWGRTRQLFLELDTSTAHGETVLELRERGRTAAALATSDHFPASLRALAYSCELSRTGRARVQERLNRPLALFLED